MTRAATVTATTVAALLLLLGGCSAGEVKDTQKPSTPQRLTAQAGSASSVHVMWEAATDDTGVTAYEVFQKGVKVKTLTGGRTMVDIERLAPSTAYTFTVRALDAAGNRSPQTAAVTMTTPAAAPEDRTAPTAPRLLRGAANGRNAATLTWARATDATGVTAYDIYQEDSRVHSVTGNVTTARVTGLRPGTVYSFTVRARDAAENSSPDSNPVDLTTAAAPGAPPATAPTGLKATARPGEIVLTWTPPETVAPVKEHQLHLNGAFATTIVWGAQPPPGPVTYTLTVTDPPGTRYSVKIRARLPDGRWGDFSAQRTVVVTGG
ncbi:fibronectin type III domain-containing protein [Streptomyces purpureus]|uniref:fibronectin type III domain-containing protein n=1 Tax=Streptomyces purpureus TaxID=1951 RepID=UPI0037AA0787